MASLPLRSEAALFAPIISSSTRRDREEYNSTIAGNKNTSQQQQQSVLLAENLATGAFSTVSSAAFEAELLRSRSAAAAASDHAVAASQYADRGSSVQQIARALRWTIRCAQGTLAGITLAMLVLAVQLPPSSDLPSSIAAFAAPLRFLQHFLGTIACVGAAVAYLQHREMVAALTNSDVNCSGGGTRAVTLRFLARHHRPVAALACYAALMLSLWAAMPCDYHLRADEGDVEVCAQTWRVLIILRFVFAVSGWCLVAQPLKDPLESASELGYTNNEWGSGPKE